MESGAEAPPRHPLRVVPNAGPLPPRPAPPTWAPFRQRDALNARRAWLEQAKAAFATGTNLASKSGDLETEIAILRGQLDPLGAIEAAMGLVIGPPVTTSKP